MSEDWIGLMVREDGTATALDAEGSVIDTWQSGDLFRRLSFVGFPLCRDEAIGGAFVDGACVDGAVVAFKGHPSPGEVQVSPGAARTFKRELTDRHLI